MNTSSDTIPEFSQMSSNLYRGGQPSKEGYAYLQSLGVKTIINFRHEKEVIERDRLLAEEYGMVQVSLPWTIYGEPKEEILTGFFDVLNRSEGRPVFFHCRRGSERTGVMAAMYYMKYENLSEKEAVRKALDGFPVLWRWKYFVARKIDFYKKLIP
ncbi:MAG: tyrosine-protein phosphatase [Candidatus Omnitrophica bacterium]|nr:tyrosine-protein phosphatase [Candidatus Omnitrophota bacterium]